MNILFFYENYKNKNFIISIFSLIFIPFFTLADEPVSRQPRHYWAQKIDVPLMPSNRHGACIAYNSKEKYTLMVGGSASTKPTGETWRWDGQWQQIITAEPAPQCEGLVFDESQNQFMMLSADRDIASSRLYVLRKTSDRWKIVENSTISPGRIGSRLAYDRARAQIVAYGGTALLMGDYAELIFTDCALVKKHPTDELGPHVAFYNDTYIWTGSAWDVLENCATPFTPLKSANLFFDAVLNRVVMFGFIEGSENLFNMWFFDTEKLIWREITVPDQIYPDVSEYPHYFYDDATKMLKVMGKSADEGFKLPLWEWDGTLWWEQSVEWLKVDAASFPEGGSTYFLNADTLIAFDIYRTNQAQVDQMWRLSREAPAVEDCGCQSLHSTNRERKNARKFWMLGSLLTLLSVWWRGRKRQTP